MKLKAIGAIFAAAFLALSALPTFAASKVTIGYFTDWGVYGRNYQASNIPINDLSTIMYAFAEVGNCAAPYATDANPTLCNPSGQYGTATGIQDYKLYSADAYSDFNTIPAGYRAAGQWGLGTISKVLKVAHAQNKQVLLSIGGWTMSVGLRTAMDKDHRATFIQSIVDFLNLVKADCGDTFDGIDIDYEPQNWGIITAQNVADYANFLHDLSAELKKQNKFVTVATWGDPANVATVGKANWKIISSSVKYIDVMTYDYHAGWDNPQVSGLLAPLHFDANQPNGVTGRTTFNVDATLQAYRDQGVPVQQIVLGVPAYGRAVAGVPNLAPAAYPHAFGLYQSFAYTPNGQWEGDVGLFDYKYIVSQMLGYGYVDYQVNGTAAAYNPNANGTFISYDNVDTVRGKVKYVQDNQLAGMMFWELSEDLNPSDPNFNTVSLIHTANIALNQPNK